jgi:ornithine decarboxylase
MPAPSGSAFRRAASASAKPEDPGEELADFALFGPTCDSADRMGGPFRLPAGMREGDWVELGQLGAYGACLRTGFNGFGRADLVEVGDPPMLATPGYE